MTFRNTHTNRLEALSLQRQLHVTPLEPGADLCIDQVLIIGNREYIFYMM